MLKKISIGLLIATAILLPKYSFAAIAFDATSEGSTGSATSLTVSHTTSGANRVLLVHILTNNTTDIITGVTYAGTAMTRLRAQVGENYGWYSYVYGLVAPATGANNIVASFSSASVIGIQAVSYTGVKQTGLPDATSSANGIGTAWTASITTVADNAWHFVAVRTASISTISGGGVVRLNTNFSGVQTTFDSNAAITPAGVHNITGTTAGGPESQWISVSIAPAPSVAPFSLWQFSIF